MKFYARSTIKDKPYKDIVLHREELLNHAEEIARFNANEGSKSPLRTLLPRVRQNVKFLKQAYHEITDYAIRTQDIIPATEWLLDNFYCIKDLREEIEKSLSAKFERQLPRISNGDLQGYPRIFGLLVELIEHTDSQVQSETLKAFINAYQVQVPLASGELWAIPIMLRIILLENIRRITEQILLTQAEHEAADNWVLPLLKSEYDQEKWEEVLKTLIPQKEYSPAYAEQILKRLRDHGADVAPLLRWIDRVVAKQDTTMEELAKLERQRQSMYQVSMGHAIQSIHFVKSEDWPRFFEEVSSVERELNKDPNQVYGQMDFESRDAYRHEVEEIARNFKVSELVIVKRVLHRAEKAREQGDSIASHVGYYLIGAGRVSLEREMEQDFGPSRKISSNIRRAIRNKPVFFYFSSLFIGIAVLSFFIYGYVFKLNSLLLVRFAVVFCLIIWASSLIVPLVNWLVSKIMYPSFLPKLELREGIPSEFRTMVVVPTLLTSVDRVKELVGQIEVYYLANRDENLHFALLGDFADASTEVVEGDREIISVASTTIENLNQKYGQSRFYFFNRRRIFNPAEGLWMGWERKRGKLAEFNRLLCQEGSTSYDVQIGELSILPTFRYVITLDADTQLPQGTAKRLVGTLAHPLHAPRLSEDGTRVVQGYGILQPRVGVSILSAGATKFSRIFSGRVGVDPYTTAVSDVYQDLFGEGIFTGKGIYDVRVFHQVTNNAFPENTILSHDLIEGLYARAGLVTDVELVDGYPASYISFMRRQHRWVRGDWQLLPWLFKPIPFISRWKIFDNLRRSLEAPAQLLLLILGFTVFVGDPLIWVGIVASSLILPMGLNILNSLCQEGDERGNIGQDLLTLLTQFVLQFLFLPYQAWIMLDAVIRSLYRQFISHQHLLEWETAADTEKRLNVSMKTMVKTMWPVILLALFSTLLIYHSNSSKLGRFIPLALLWVASLWVAYHVSLPLVHKKEVLSDSDYLVLRRFARKIWSFFEEFVCNEDHWLPPDNVQIDPNNGVAHRTSPTNIGLALLANLSARDFGYITLTDMFQRIEHTLNTIDQLGHWKGHLYNWYDTRSLKPLEPLYVSTVDSGNFVLYLMTLKSGLAEIADKPLLDLQYARGLKDTVNLLIEAIGLDCDERLNIFNQALDHLLTSAEPISLECWVNLLELWPVLSGSELSTEGLYWLQRMDRMIQAFRLEMREIYPWFKDSLSLEISSCLTAQNLQTFNLFGLANCYTQILEDRNLSMEIRKTVQQALNKVQDCIHNLENLQHRLEKMVLATDFCPLFDETRQLFSIGYRVTESMLDKSYYDLLASEARQASFIAIAKGDVPHSHWFKLGRSLTLAKGKRSLVSWSGTMFEFLMPLLVMRNYEGTLLDETYHSVIEVQRKYGYERKVPWGISESGFYAFDPQLNYQYKAFGVPGLGLKRGIIQDLVIAPYASFLALMVSPRDSLGNIIAMQQKGFGGRYGLYEAADYTHERVPAGRSFMLIKSFMAHHQGMSLLALDNVLFENRMQKRLHNEPLIQAAELLLQERLPMSTPAAPQPEGERMVTERKAEEAVLDNDLVILTGPANSSIPITHCISNGQYSVMLTNSGAGFSRFRRISLTRWREDVTRDAWGMYFYIQNLNSGDVWSATYQPCRFSGEDYKVIYAPDRVEFSRSDGNITTRTEVVVSPEDQAEMRRISLTNHSKHDRIVEVTSYFEVVLARASEDLAHPAFGNLFIQTEIAQGSLLASRRPRSENQTQLWLMHSVATEGGERVGSLQYETDRARFIGRGRSLANPQALDANHPLSNTVGAVLDPMMSLRQRVRISPGQTVRVSFSLGYAESREDILSLAEKYRDPLSVNRAFELAWTQSTMELRHLNMTAAQANESLSLGGHLLYLSPCRRDEAECIMHNCQGQSSLWPYAISGDLPIVLVRVNDAENLDLVRRLIKIHEYWRLKGLYADLVILNEDESGYVQAFQDTLRDIISMGHARDLVNESGGIFLLQKGHVRPEDITLLCAVARITFKGEGGSCSFQVRKKGKIIFPGVERDKGIQQKAHHSTSQMDQDKICEFQAELADSQIGQLLFANGYGGFSEDGREYIIKLQDDMNTPLPWVNVVANPKFGFQVSEAGAGYTWSLNSRENKLTPWSNDPITDPSGEALFLRDEESGEFWSVTASPKREKGLYTIRHGQGYSIFEHCSHGLKQTLRLFVPIMEPVKAVELTITNQSNRSFNLSTVCYVEWVMGVVREQTAPYLVTKFDEKKKIFLTRNTYQEEFAGRIGFLAAVGAEVSSYTGDRSEFIGRNGSLEDPRGLKMNRLSGTVGAGLDPCSAIQLKLSVSPGETKTITFLLGETENQTEAERIVQRYQKSEKLNEAFEEVKRYWDKLLGTIQVDTPDPAMNLLLNRWLLYQTVVCRLWARSAFYQSGGAYGFRDQLQDVMALAYTTPQTTREQILLACRHQFLEGDVQHWWHAEKGKGIRTKFSDDLLWLPFVAAHYIDRTGDESILDESVLFLKDQPLGEDEDERYSIPEISLEQASVYEHCIRAIERGLRFGEHGLPLIGSGDWNDGFSRIGPIGRGESVWLGWFLYIILNRFAKICDACQDLERGVRYRQIAEELLQNIELHGWDGGWYRRAYFDDGTPLGSSQNPECQIDALAQSWSVISGAAKSSRTKDAMLALEHYLWRKEDGILLLLTPPFNKFLPDPGYIKGYVPGVRENGGQYTHGAIWTILAYAALGEGDKATELFQMLNPIHHARTEHEVNRYKVEPYVMAADVYAIYPHVGRGGWTWYTGAAGWMYQVGLEGILGFKRQGDKLVIKPCISSRWTGFRLTYQYLTTQYKIIVENPMGRMTGCEKVILDNNDLQEPVILLNDDGQVHTIRLIL